MSDSCNPTDCSPPASSVHWISQARILEWIAISFSREFSGPRDRTCLSCLIGRFFTTEAPGKHRGILVLVHIVDASFSGAKLWLFNHNSSKNLESQGERLVKELSIQVCNFVHRFHHFQSFAWECFPGSELQSWCHFLSDQGSLSLCSIVCRFSSPQSQQNEGDLKIHLLFLWVHGELQPEFLLYGI